MIKWKRLKAGEELPKSKYKGVHSGLNNGAYINWIGQIMISGKRKTKNFPTEKEAAKWYDMHLIRNGKEPVNILKRA